MALQEITFKNSKGQVLTGMIRYTEQSFASKCPAVIILHGFNESMQQGITADIANALVYQGFFTLRFDFHGHGGSEGEFEQHTITQQIDDVLSALDYISSLDIVDKDRIAVIGTDIGGNIAMLAAAQDPRIKAVVVQGARSHFDKHIDSHFQEHDYNELMRNGVYSHSTFTLRSGYVTSADKHDVPEELKNLHAPLMIIHGTADMRVQIQEAREILMSANEPKALEEVEGADHWFRAEGEREKFIELAAQWIKRWVR